MRESDETFIGGKAKTAHKNKPLPQKHAVMRWWSAVAASAPSTLRT